MAPEEEQPLPRRERSSTMKPLNVKVTKGELLHRLSMPLPAEPGKGREGHSAARGDDDVGWFTKLVGAGMPRSYARYRRNASCGDLETLGIAASSMMIEDDDDLTISPALRRFTRQPPSIKRCTSPLVVNFPGGGKFFYWQSGVATFLNQHFDLSEAHLVGASAGSLTAAIMACNVDAYYAAEIAIKQLKTYGVYERPMGLIGVWGGVVRDWLREILPEDAAQRCNGRVHISVLKLPYRRVHVSNFSDKEDLIGACMASSHLPMVMDGRPVYMWRGWPCIDGSIMAARKGLPKTLLTGGALQPEILTVDYMDDQDLLATGTEFMQLSEPDTLYRLIDHGYRYAEKHFSTDEALVGITRRRLVERVGQPPTARRRALEYRTSMSA